MVYGFPFIYIKKLTLNNKRVNTLTIFLEGTMKTIVIALLIIASVWNQFNDIMI